MRRSRPDAHLSDDPAPAPQGSHRRHRRRLSVSPFQLVQTWLLVAVLLVGFIVVLIEARHDAKAQNRDLALGVARSVANSPLVLSAAGTSDPPTRLRAYAESVRRANEVDFVVIMAPDRTRWTHPDRTRVGKQFAGNLQPALDGETFTETSGLPDPSVRAIAPVVDGNGQVVALVAVGASTGAMTAEVARRLPWLLLLVVLAAALAYAGGPLATALDRQRSARSEASRARATDA